MNMRRSLGAFALLLAVVLPGPGEGVHAAEAEQSTTGGWEITALLDYLGDSDCEFFRNGDWYQADKARSHLQRKYDYLRKRKPDLSAEEFIVNAATQSSRSGDAYAVRCPGTDELPSAQWFNAELQRLRSGGKGE